MTDHELKLKLNMYTTLLSHMIKSFFISMGQMEYREQYSDASEMWADLINGLSEQELFVLIPLFLKCSFHLINLSEVDDLQKVDIILKICLKTNNTEEILDTLDRTDIFLYHRPENETQDEILRFILNHNIDLGFSDEFNCDRKDKFKESIAKITKQRELMQQTVCEFLSADKMFEQLYLWDKNVCQIISEYISY